MAEVQVLYAATAGGIVQLASPGTSHRWRAIGDALAAQDVSAVRASASDPLAAYAGTTSALYATHDGGATWSCERDIPVTALAADEDGSIYAGTRDGAILRGGAGDWSEVHRGGSPVVRLTRLATGRIAAVYKSGEVDIRADETWRPANLVVPRAKAIASSVAAPNELFVATDTSLVTRYGSHLIDSTTAHTLVVLAGKPEVLLIGTRSLVQRSDDRGNTFTPVEGPHDVQVLVSPPHYQDYAYAGTGSGELWLSADRGRTWRKLHEGMAAVRDLSFSRVR